MLTENKNGFLTFVAPPKSVKAGEKVVFDPNRDTGASYILSSDKHRIELGSIVAGTTLIVTTANKGFKALIELVPDSKDGICYRGHYMPGSALIAHEARTGDYLKIASLDGEMWQI